MSEEPEGEWMEIYTDIGIECGSTDVGEEIISLLLPTETSEIDDCFGSVAMTLACAKSLLIDLRDAIEVAIQHKQGEGPRLDCNCYACLVARKDEIQLARMILCAQCGNKRCPHATNHELECTGSNEPGQAGSNYE